MRFLIDAQLPPDLARQLTSLGHEAEHVADCGLLDVSDEKIWSYAVAAGMAIVTKDRDFADTRSLRDGPQIVWLRFGNTRKAELVRRLLPHMNDIVLALQNGDSIVEVR